MPDSPSEQQVRLLTDVLELTEAEARGLTAGQATRILGALTEGQEGQLSPEEVGAVLEAEGVWEFPSQRARRERDIKEAQRAEIRQLVDAFNQRCAAEGRWDRIIHLTDVPRSEPHAN
jgi:hypothetical protein